MLASGDVLPAAAPPPASALPASLLFGAAPAAPERQGRSASPANTAAPPPPLAPLAPGGPPGMMPPAGQAGASVGVLTSEVAWLRSKLDLAEAQLAAAQEAAADLAGQGTEEERLMARLEVERRETDVQTAGLKLGTAQRRLARSRQQAA